MTLVEFVIAQGWPEDAIYSHLHRHGVCADVCTQLSEIASPDYARCIAHLRGLNAVHIGRIIAKARQEINSKND